MSETSRKIAFQLVDYAMSLNENVIFEHVFKPNSTNLFTQLLEKYPHYDVKLVKLVGNLDTLYDRYITRTFSSEKRHNCFEANSFQPNDEKYSKTLANIEPLSKEVYIDTLNQITSFHLKGVEEICLNTNNFFNDSSCAVILSAFK